MLPQANAYAMIGRLTTAAGIVTKLGNHSFRAAGITAYLKNGGTLEKTAATANHASTRTTQLYDRRRDEVSLDEVERIVIEILDRARSELGSSDTMDLAEVGQPTRLLIRRKEAPDHLKSRERKFVRIAVHKEVVQGIFAYLTAQRVLVAAFKASRGVTNIF